MDQDNLPTDSDLIPIEGLRKKRSSWIAFFVSLLTPGIGQIYNDQVLKGIVFILVLYLFLFLSSVSGLFDTFPGLMTILVVEIGFRIYIIYDAVKVARTREVELPLPARRVGLKWSVAATIIIAMFLVNWRLVTGYQTFSIPSTGNEPTVFVDDCLIADMRYYNSHEPARGDLVVFQGEDGLPYCFRVVALPGDRFQLIDNVISIDGTAATAEYLCDTASEEMTGVKKYREILPGSAAHKILLSDMNFEGMIRSTDEMIIPVDYYYLLGDNRDNALDSRYRGLIHRSEILGKCLYTYWGGNSSRLNVRLTND